MATIACITVNAGGPISQDMTTLSATITTMPSTMRRSAFSLKTTTSVDDIAFADGSISIRWLVYRLACWGSRKWFTPANGPWADIYSKLRLLCWTPAVRDGWTEHLQWVEINPSDRQRMFVSIRAIHYVL